MRKKLFILTSILWILTECLLGPSPTSAEEDVAGVWASPFGIMTLERNGSQVIGAYFFYQGVLEGTLTGSTIVFHWRDAVDHSGDGRFELQPDGNTLKAFWDPTTVASTGPWLVTRVTDPPDPPGQRSHWIIEMEVKDNPLLAGRVAGTADLFCDNDVIAGRLAGMFIPERSGACSASCIVPEAVNNFCSVTGTRSSNRLILQFKSAQDGTITHVGVTGDGLRYQGTWQDDPNPPSRLGETPQHGTISLTRQETGRTETLTEQAWKRHAYFWRMAKSIKQPWASPLNGDPLFVAMKMLDDGNPEGATAAFASLAQAYRTAQDNNRLAEALSGEASALETSGRFEEARQRYQEMLKLPGLGATQKIIATAGLSSVQFSIGGTPPQPEPPPDITALAEDDPIKLKDKARSAAHSGDIDAAVALFDQAIARYQAGKETPTNPVLRRARDIDIATTLQHSALAEMSRKHWAEASARLERSLTVWRMVEGSADSIASTEKLLSFLRQKQGQVPEARAAIGEALDLAQKNHAGVTWDLYAQAARVEVAAGSDALAERYFQKAIDNVETLRGRLVTDETKVGFLGAISSPAEIYEEYVAFLMDRAKTDAALTVAERARARALLDVLDPQGKGLDPGYAFGHETPSTTVSDTITADAARKLAQTEHVAYLVYCVTNQAAYVWLLGPDGNIASGRIGASAQALRKNVEALGKAMSRNLPAEEPRRALTHLLSAPVATVLAGLPKGTRLTIVPHKFLAQVPFSALGESLGDWGAQWVLTSLPSLSLANRLSTSPVSRQGPLLAVGHPAGATGLIYSEDEVRQAADLFPGATILLGAAATRQKVLAELPRHRLALFSTHTQKKNETTAQLGVGKELELELSGPERLSRRDLMRGSLAGMGLVILSACSSSVGPQFAGDELMNFARAFLVAGAERVLMTLWDVEDKASAEIVSAFLSRIKKGDAPPIALQGAIGQYRNRLRSDNTPPPPSTWAPWILVEGHE